MGLPIKPTLLPNPHRVRSDLEAVVEAVVVHRVPAPVLVLVVPVHVLEAVVKIYGPLIKVKIIQ